MWLRFDWPAHGGDTQRILEEAHNLTAGRPLGPSGLTFLLPHLILSGIDRLGLPVIAYVGVQVMFALVATYALLAMVTLAGGSLMAAIAASTVWALNPLAQQMNTYLLSDGLYQSLLIITAYCLLRAIDTNRMQWTIAAGISLLGIAFCRPQGQMWPAIVALVVATTARRSRLTWVAIGALVLLQATLLVLSHHYAVQKNIVQHFERGEVIWGYSAGRLTMPAWTGDAEGGLRSVIEYALAHPFSSARLAAARILVEMSNLRPFYSTLHNVSSVVLYWPLYAMAAVGVRAMASSPAKTLCVTAFIAHLLFVGATHADSDGRWFLEVLPFLLIWASLALFGDRHPRSLSA
jgi:hypothetical protein